MKQTNSKKVATLDANGWYKATSLGHTMSKAFSSSPVWAGRVPEFVASPDAVHGSNTLNKQGAERLARYIEDRWYRAGYPNVKCEVFREPNCGHGGGTMIYAVRSNLVNGLPPTEGT